MLVNFLRYLIRINILIVMLFINIVFIFSENNESLNETDELKYIVGLDFGYTIIAFKNIGYGIGLNYEHKLTNFLSVKAGYGHMVCFFDIPVVYNELQFYLYLYPLNIGLNKLYFGFGSSCSFIRAPGREDIPFDIAVSVIPIIGYKWRIFKYIMVDPNIGWKFNVMKTNNLENFNSILNNGFQWGINIKIFIER